jgi:HlyD family secretion protein
MGEALAGRRRWILVAATVVVLALIGYGVVHALTADATVKPKAAATAAVDKGAVTTEVATTGTLQPSQTRSLSFAVSSTVTSVSVRAGTTVEAGQVLAKVDSTDAATAVDDAQDSLDQAESALTEARSNATKSSSTTGCNVAAGYTSTSATATATATATASPSATATATASPSASASATATATATATRKPTATSTKSKTGSTCSTGSSQQGGGQNTGSDAILSAEQRVTSATTTLEQAEEALEGATITAPIAGRILTVGGKVGSQVNSGSTFITLADVYDMQISADFPEADADRLAISQHGVITLADQPGKEFKATVVQVDPTGTSDGTMVRYGVLLAFDDAPTDLLVGQSASVKVTTGSKTEVLRVPSTAVHDVHGSAGTVLKGGAQVPVGVGLRGDQYTEITSGLADGDVVVRSW